MKKRKVGLALGGGDGRSMAHIEECILEGGFAAIDTVTEIKRRLAA